MILRNTIRNDAHVIFNKSLAHKFGINAALLLSDLISKERYFDEKGKLVNGWFFNTSDNIERDTCLTEHERRTATKKLKAAGAIQVELRGLPATNFYCINHEVCLEAISQTSSQESEQLKDSTESDTRENVNSDESVSSQESRHLDVRIPDGNKNNGIRITSMEKPIKPLKHGPPEKAQAPDSKEESVAGASPQDYLKEYLREERRKEELTALSKSKAFEERLNRAALIAQQIRSGA